MFGKIESVLETESGDRQAHCSHLNKGKLERYEDSVPVVSFLKMAQANFSMKTICDRIDDFLDGDLSRGEFQCFEKHLVECDACRSTVGECREIGNRLRQGWQNVETDAASIFDESRKVARVEKEPLAWSKRRRRYLLFCATVSAMLLVASSLIQLRAVTDSGLSDSAVMIDEDAAERGARGFDRSRAENESNSSATTTQPPITNVVIRGEAIGLPVVEDEEFTLIRVFPTRIKQQPFQEEEENVQ